MWGVKTRKRGRKGVSFPQNEHFGRRFLNSKNDDICIGSEVALREFLDNKIAQEHGKKTAEKTACGIKQGNEGVVATQQGEILVAERGECGETATQSCGEKQCCGVVAEQTTRSKCVEKADE